MSNAASETLVKDGQSERAAQTQPEIQATMLGLEEPGQGKDNRMHEKKAA